jgi:hypothetical protein
MAPPTGWTAPPTGWMAPPTGWKPYSINIASP